MLNQSTIERTCGAATQLSCHGLRQTHDRLFRPPLWRQRVASIAHHAQQQLPRCTCKRYHTVRSKMPLVMAAAGGGASAAFG